MSKTRIPASSTNKSSKAPWILLTASAVAIAVAALYLWPNSLRAVSDDADIVVYKMATCGCCENWAGQMRDAGFAVNMITVDNTLSIQSKMGVPRTLGSCHTAVIGDYWVEGHVPPDLVQRLISEKPENIRGIAVPGMPVGSAGMEGPNPVEYDVIAYDKDGKTFVYATRQGRSSVDDD
jgi:hypothetical protein